MGTPGGSRAARNASTGRARGDLAARNNSPATRRASTGRAQGDSAATDQAQRSAATRTQILDTALGVFATSGYRAASIRDIAAKCGISHPTLLYHFPSKAALLMAVLNRRDEIDIEDEVFSELEPRAMLRHLIISARNNTHARGIVELFAQLSAEASDASHPAHNYFAQRYAELRSDLERSFTALEGEGALVDTVTPAQAAAHVIAVMDGLQVQWLLDPDAVDMETSLAALLRAFVRAL